MKILLVRFSLEATVTSACAIAYIHHHTIAQVVLSLF